MPPQPLGKGKRVRETIVVGETATNRPDLCQMVAQAISIWPDIEFHFGALLMTLLGANSAPSMAMFYALNSTSAQKAALNAAAQSIFGENSAEMKQFIRAVQETRVAASHRNRFCHWVWAHDLRKEDAILFIDPEALAEHDGMMHTITSPFSGRNLTHPIDLGSIYVYHRKDMHESINMLKETSRKMADLRLGVRIYVRFETKKSTKS